VIGVVTPYYLSAQPANTALTIRADVQEANANTGVVTARGNVRIDYPARQIVATAAQAQYFANEQKIVLSGNVVVTQQGVNSIRAETITYLVDTGQFIALPPKDQQVESVYIVPDRDLANTPATVASPIEQIKPAFKSPVAPRP
jgi:lipopolysaccharide export system protein LptA